MELVQAYGCTPWQRSSFDIEADSHKLFAALQNSLYCESVQIQRLTPKIH